jgi:hypothetical protein
MMLFGKSIGDYWASVKMLVIISVVLSIINFAFLIAVPLFGLVISGLIGLVALLLPVYAGWNGVKKWKFDVMQGAAAGGVYGLVSGVIGGIISILMFSIGFGAFGGGAAGAAIGGGLAIVGAIIGIPIAVVIGAILAAIGAFAAQSMGK